MTPLTVSSPPLSVDILKDKVLFPSSIELRVECPQEEQEILENLQNEENWILSALQDRVKVTRVKFLTIDNLFVEFEINYLAISLFVFVKELSTPLLNKTSSSLIRSSKISLMAFLVLIVL